MSWKYCIEIQIKFKSNSNSNQLIEMIKIFVPSMYFISKKDASESLTKRIDSQVDPWHWGTIIQLNWQSQRFVSLIWHTFTYDKFMLLYSGYYYILQRKKISISSSKLVYKNMVWPDLWAYWALVVMLL